MTIPLELDMPDPSDPAATLAGVITGLRVQAISSQAANAAVLRGEDAPLLPGIADGLRGMTFIDTAVRASAANAGWVDLTD